MTSVERSLVSARTAVARGLVLLNPASGPRDLDALALAGYFDGADIVKCAPTDLGAHVRDVRKDGRPFVAIAGGDGSIRTAARELAHSDIALLAIPAGTHNHFAKALGITDLVTAAAASRGENRAIDLGRVNDRCFVNNSSIGFYPGIVELRDEGPQWLPKTLATVLATFRSLRDDHHITVTIDRRPVRAWLVFVGNNCYGERVTDIGSRESLDDHILDVRVVRADHYLARLRLVAAALFGRAARAPVIERRTCRRITIDVHGRSVVDVALDGEVERLPAPLRYESDTNALSVLVPNR